MECESEVAACNEQDRPVAFSGMGYAGALIRCGSPRELREQICELLARDFGFVHVECLYLSAGGKWFGSDDTATRFLSDDLRHPYAYVFSHGNALRTEARKVLAKFDHPAFKARMANIPSSCQLAFRPIRTACPDRKWLGILMLAGHPSEFQGCLDAEGYSDFEALLALHWHRLQNQPKTGSQQMVTNSPPAGRQEALDQRLMAEELARTLIGTSATMCRVREQILLAAGTRLSVLLQGETGTGKDYAAKAVHDCSARRDKPFIAVNCAAIPESLLESELFGYARGAFSGADQERGGLVSRAHGGTLFLDEIGDMPALLQAKLLRVLETGRYRPLGGAEEIQADFRIISATHQPLAQLIKKGNFREDLYYRLSQFPICLPPLRERRRDIPMLAERFVSEFAKRESREDLEITSGAIQFLEQRNYPGNLRELRNLIDYACAVTPEGAPIDADLLSREEGTAHSVPELLESIELVDNLREALSQYERAIIRRRLNSLGGNLGQAAESLGLPRRTLAYKCRRLGVEAMKYGS